LSQPPHHRIAGPAGDIAIVDHGGHGPDVVLCHGANRSLLDWERMRPHLTDMRLISYDLRGHGLSDLPMDGDYSWAAHLADLDAIIDALALDNPRVIGHSLGGMIALCHGQRHPLCPGVVNLDGLGGGRTELYPGLEAEVVADRRAEQLAAHSAALAPDVLDAEQAELAVERARQTAAVYGLDTALEEAGTRRSLQLLEDGRYRRKPAASAQAALMEPLEGWNALTVAREAVCPTLLVQGGQAPNLARLPAPLRELNEALLAGVRNGLEALRTNGRPGLRVTQVPEAGHMLHLQAPKEVGSLVRDFLLS
jgi:pimeloyl-ACP methyl ester carboxylesterase